MNIFRDREGERFGIISEALRRNVVGDKLEYAQTTILIHGKILAFPGI